MFSLSSPCMRFECKGKKNIFKEKGVRFSFKNRDDYDKYVNHIDEILKDKSILDVSLKGIPIKKKIKIIYMK